MTSIRRFLALSTFLTLAGFGSAQAATVAPGDYRLAVGSADCSLTLAADGTASPGACVTLGNAAHWRSTPAGLNLTDGSGTLLAALRAKDDGYAGTTADQAHNVKLTPTAQTAAAH